MTDQIPSTTTSQDDDDDIKVLDNLIASLEDENEQIVQAMEDTQTKIETESAPFIERINDDSEKLKDLQTKAEEEENQGQIQNVQTQIDQM